MGEIIQKVPYSVWTNKLWRDLNSWAMSELVNGNTAKAATFIKLQTELYGLWPMRIDRG